MHFVEMQYADQVTLDDSVTSILGLLNPISIGFDYFRDTVEDSCCAKFEVIPATEFYFIMLT